MKYLIFGFGGHAREVIYQMEHLNYNIKCYVDDVYSDNINSFPISKFNPLEEYMIVAIGDSNKRKEIIKNLPKNTKYFSFIHPTALIGKNVEIGCGSFIGAYSILTTNIKIDKHSLLNRGNQIGHDCEIGDYLSMMPGSIISGNVTIGNNVYIGTNSSIKEKINIHSSTTIGLNAGVVNHINNPGIYIGTPAKRIK